jgi:toxin-antitoxin system PIN domain toxin
MPGSLLDVNVLVALMWPTHEFHARAQEWFARRASHGWATCPFTEAAFVRIVSNPAFSPDALTPQEALALLRANLRPPYHRFWSEDISFSEAVDPFQNKFFGYQQVSDVYLLGLALHKKGKLATLDRGILGLLPPGSPERVRVEVI